MDRPTQLLGKGPVHQALSLDSVQAAKRLGNHRHGKVALSPLPRSGVTPMMITVVHDLERHGGEGRRQLGNDGVADLTHIRLPNSLDNAGKRVSPLKSAASILECENFDRILVA
jgi:hypothetical protein